MSAPQFTNSDKETLVAEMRDLGCPYALGDPRVRSWIEGYKAGNQSAYAAAMALAEEVFGKEVRQ